VRVLPQAVEHTDRGDVYCLAPVLRDPVEHASEHRARGVARWFALAPLGFAKYCPAYTARDIGHLLFLAFQRSGHALDLIAAHWYDPVSLVFAASPSLSITLAKTLVCSFTIFSKLFGTLLTFTCLRARSFSAASCGLLRDISIANRMKVVRKTTAIAFEAFQF